MDDAVGVEGVEGEGEIDAVGDVAPAAVGAQALDDDAADIGASRKPIRAAR